MKPAQVIERLFWSAVSSGGAGLVGVPLLGIEVWQAAALSALGALVNGVTQFARYRLSVLPNPGEGLPGLPVEGGP